MTSFMFYRVFIQYEWPLLRRQVTNSTRYRGINRKFGETTDYMRDAKTYIYTKQNQQ